MRYICIAIVFALCFGAGRESKAQEARGVRPNLADVPREFRFLVYSTEDLSRSSTELWADLPYDSISLERSDDCFLACPSYRVTFYRGRGADRPRHEHDGDGRAELHAVAPRDLVPYFQSGAVISQDGSTCGPMGSCLI